MSYIGQAALKNSELKRFDVTSSTSATHVLSWTAPNEQSLWITINGVKQQDDAYSIAGIPTTITLTDALVATDKMEVIGVLDIGVITIVGDNTISTAKIAPDAVTAAEIATDAVGTSEIAANAVDTSEIAANAVTLTELADGTQGGTLYYGAAGAPTELAAGTSGYFLKTLGAAANPVWGVPTEFNDTAILNDIATLALHSATQNNQTAFNLTNAFVDQYEDSSGLDVLTDVVRTSGEYMTSIVPGVLQSTMEVAKGAYNSQVSNQAGTNQTLSHSGSGNYVGGLIKYLYPLGTQDSRIRVYRTNSSGVVSNSLYNVFGVVMSPDTDLNFTDMPGTATFDFYGYVSSTGNRDTLTTAGTVTRGLGVTSYSADWAGVGNTSIGVASGQIVGWYQNSGSEYNYGWECFYDASANTIKFYQGITGVNAATGAFTATKESSASITLTGVPTTGYFYVTFGEASGPDYVAINATGVTMDASNGVLPLINATGNFTSATQTALATVSKMSIVVLYKNNAGTASLDGDLVAQVSSNGGTNYTSAPLTAAGTFSTGILMAKSNDITISNTGTAPKYKISLANQAEGSKETYIYGVSLQY